MGQDIDSNLSRPDLPYGLRRRLTSVFLIIIISLASVNIITLAGVGLYYRMLSGRLDRQSLIQELVSSTRSYTDDLVNYSRSGNPQYIEGLSGRMERITKTMTTLQSKEHHSSPAWYKWDDLARMLSTYQEIQDLLISEVSRGVVFIYLRARGDEIERLSGYIGDELTKIAAESIKEMSEFYRGFSRRITGLAALSVVLLAFFLVLSLFATRRFVLSVSRPIHGLALQLVRFGEGELETRVGDIEGKDEIAVLGRSFDVMADRIRSLINSIRDQAGLEQRLAEQETARQEAERLLKEAELAHLQAQINPHFLFNTLNLLGSLCILEAAPRTGLVLADLTELLRYSLRSGSQPASLSTEVDVVRSYMNIQAVRFGGKISYEEILEEGLNEVQIPAMILQPLVENAVKHGLEPIERRGTVGLTISTIPGGRIEIVISDDGVGISDKALQLLDDSGVVTSSLGIRNVRRRLELHYNRNVLFLSRRPGGGTECRLEIPGRNERR
jgi:signal transduction histidine kinase